MNFRFNTYIRFLLCADIHGDAESASEIIKLNSELCPDKILLLGDVLYHGPRNPLPSHYDPKAVATLLNTLSSKITAVRGNCDAEVDQMLLDFPILGDSALVYADGHEFFMSHGHVYNEDNLPKGDSVLLYGHTHIPSARRVSGRVCFNPGSVSLPKEGWPRSYGLYENDMLYVKELFTNKELLSVKI